jgi:hypothetical protein
VPDELGVQQNSAQVGVPEEPYPEHVPALSLHPVGAAPQVAQRRDRSIFSRLVADARLQPEAMTQVERVEVRHDLEAGIPIGVVDRRQIGEHVHLRGRCIAQEPTHLMPAPGIQHDGFVAVLGVSLEDRQCELVFQ